MQNEITPQTISSLAPLTELACRPQDVLRATALIQEVMAAVMKDGEHYGIIQGTSGKRSLFKSGAEKLCFTFGLSNKLEIKLEQFSGGHREYTIICNLFDRSGNLRGQGVGSASTLESKYRYRGAGGKPCPACGAQSAKASKKEYGGGYYCDAKSGGCGQWKVRGGSPESAKLDAIPNTRLENPDPADQYNTVLKMAKKRALVDAVLTATAASDCFAQDLEELEGEIDAAEARDSVAKPVQARTGVDIREIKPSEIPTTTHPAITSANKLWATLEQRDGKGSGTPVVVRLCKIYGANAPKDLPQDKLELFGKDIEELTKSNKEQIQELLAGWELAAKEGAK